MKRLATILESRSRRYLILVICPTFLACCYLLVLSAKGYVSRAQVMVEGDSSVAAMGAEFVQGLVNVGAGKSKQDALLVEKFMYSRVMLEHLDAELGLRKHFSAPRVDILGRLDRNASMEDFLDYYRGRLKIKLDEQALILSIEFTAFDPDFAHEVVRKLIARSEIFVNEVSRQFALEQLRFVEEQVSEASSRLQTASREVIGLQRDNEVLSPQWETEAVAKILGGLEAQLAEQRAELKAMTAYLNVQAPDVIAARQRVRALEQQIAQERDRLVGRQAPGLNDLMLEYQGAETNVKLAGELYKAALATLETTRLDAARKVKILVSVDRPSKPDSAEHPRVLYWVASIFILLNLAYFVMGLVIATVEDHRE